MEYFQVEGQPRLSKTALYIKYQFIAKRSNFNFIPRQQNLYLKVFEELQTGY